MTIHPLERRTLSGLSAAENHLIKQQSLFAAADAIFRIFLGLYLFDIGGVETVAIFFIFRYVAMSVGFVLFGKLLRWHSTVKLMRVSMLLLSAVCVLLIAFGQDAVKFVVLLGVLAGLAEGIYWPGVSASVQEATHERTRNTFFARRTAWNRIAAACAPPLAGLVFFTSSTFTDRSAGYLVLFAVLVVVLLIARYELRGMPDWGGSQEKLYSVSKSFRRPRPGEWFLVLAQHFCAGTWTTALGVFVPILTFKIVASELGVGLLSGATTVVTAIAAILAGRALKRWPRSFWYGVIVVPLGLVTFGLLQNWLGLAAYVFLVAAGDMVTLNAACKPATTAVERSPSGWKNNYHLFVELEAALNAGRVTGFIAILLLLNVATELDAVHLGILAVTPLALIAGLCQVGLSRYEMRSIPANEPAEVRAA